MGDADPIVTYRAQDDLVVTGSAHYHGGCSLTAAELERIFKQVQEYLLQARAIAYDRNGFHVDANVGAGRLDPRGQQFQGL